MPVRIGVDVGGTFTKAVACDAATGEISARVAVPTTHRGPEGVARGVAQAIGEVGDDVAGRGLGPVHLVAHSTTQAVNSLLEGDTATVGVLGIGYRPDLNKARRRTRVRDIRLAPGRSLRTVHAFVDGSGGVRRRALAAAIDSLVAMGAQSLCVSEAFGVDDARAERLALEVARAGGIPACAGHELTGLYGLELRTVTAALNASILPASLDTAAVVERAVEATCSSVPLLVMRGDGGAADLNSARTHPLVTAFSGPAASVAGALRCLTLHDAVVVEVGGTSTNVSVIRAGRPVLAYVRVLDHVTSVRSLDVRVVGVAGGSMVRVARRIGRYRIEDVGPRSAHIAGLPYASFSPGNGLERGRVRLLSPLAGDPCEYAVIENPAGRQFALTPTCAASALEEVAQGSYAQGDARAARAGFEALGRFMETDWRTAARAVLRRASDKIAAVVSEASRDAALERSQLIGVGGGAGALVPGVAHALDLDWRIPADAEVISSVGDALSLVRVEMEAMVKRSTGTHEIARLHRAAEDAAVAAGAAPSSLQIESEAVPERSALRVVATGSVALEGGAAPTEAVSREAARRIAEEVLGETSDLVAAGDHHHVFAVGESPQRRFAVIDRRGSVAASGEGTMMSGSGEEVAALLRARMPSMVRRVGPVSIAPSVRVLRGPRLVDLSLLSSPDRALDAALDECARANGDTVVAFLTRP